MAGLALLFDRELPHAWLMGQRILVNLLETPSVLSTAKAPPMTAPDSSFSHPLSACIRVHLCASA
jgi:hypothetical protein